VSTRPYNASGRRAAAEERRRRIIAAAARLFGERGWAGTTLAEIAAEAGVSLELLTKTFGTKAALFQAALSQVGFEGYADVAEAFDGLHLDAVEDPERRLDAIVDFTCATMERLAPLVPVLVSGAEQNPVLRDAMLAARAAHARSSAAAVRVLVGVTAPEDAPDEVYVLTRAETYLAFVQQRGWEPLRYAAWLRRSLRQAVALD